MAIQLTRLEAQCLMQAAEVALNNDQTKSVFYDDHRTAVRRAMRKVELYLKENPDLE